MTTLISEHDVVDDGSKWRICWDIELRDYYMRDEMEYERGESTGPGGQDRGQVIRVRGFGMRHTTSYLQKFLVLRLGLCLLGIVRRHGRGRCAGRHGGR